MAKCQNRVYLISLHYSIFSANSIFMPFDINQITVSLTVLHEARDEWGGSQVLDGGDLNAGILVLDLWNVVEDEFRGTQVVRSLLHPVGLVMPDVIGRRMSVSGVLQGGLGLVNVEVDRHDLDSILDDRIGIE